MNKKTTWLLTSVLTVSALMAGCSGDEEKTSNTAKKEDKQVLNLLETSEIPSLDTSVSTDSVSFKAFVNVMEGLYRLDENNKPTPGMAEKVDVSEDKKKYTFHLREAKWSNGEPVTAQDFEYAWKRALDPKTGSQYAFILYDIKGAQAANEGKGKLDDVAVKAVDDKTLEVELVNAVPYFLELTTFPTYFPLKQSYVESQGDKYALEANTVLYNGPFVMSDWQHEKSYTLTKNKDYWDAGTVKLEEINVSIVKELSTGVNLYRSGEVDRADLAAEFIDEFKDSEEFKTYQDPRLFFIRFNQDNEVFANKNVRKAIDLAYDKKGITDQLLNDGSLPAYSLIPKNFVTGPDGKDFRDTAGDVQVTNADEAKTYWEQAKKELGKDSIKVEMLNYDTDTSKKVGEFIEAQLEENLPGLDIHIKQQPFKQKLDLEAKQQYEFSLSGWGPDYPDPMTFADMFITSSPFNQMSYSNKEYDKLIADAKGPLLLDLPARWESFQKAEQILIKEDAAISPVYQRGMAYLEKDYVKGVVKHVFGGDYSYKWAYIEGK